MQLHGVHLTHFLLKFIAKLKKKQLLVLSTVKCEGSEHYVYTVFIPYALVYLR
jgi:hypothetical protein